MKRLLLTDPVFKIYLLGAILVPLGAAVAVSAYAAGNLITTIVGAIVTFGSAIVTIVLARNISRRERANKTYDASKRAPRQRRIAIFVRTCGLITILLCVCFLTIAFMRNRPWLITVEVAFLMLIGGFIFLFITPTTDSTNVHRRKKRQKAKDLPAALHDYEQNYQNRHFRGW